MSRREPRYVSLVLGILFVLLGVGYLLGHAVGWHVNAGWLVPTALIALGAAGVVSAVRWFVKPDDE